MSGNPAANQPLAGVTVLDLTQIYNGPYATFLMAAAGARVVKIEPPEGEHLRKRQASKGITEPFAVLNARKESLALDLKQAAAKDVLLRLVAKADVLVENFAPGVMDRLGLGEEVLRVANPKLIIASSSGYGSTGPYRDYPAMDVTVQAMTGVIGITGFDDGPAVKAGPAIGDFFGGVHLYGAILTALYRRATTGIGSTVEVSMMSAVFPSLLSNLGLYRPDLAGPKRTGNRHGGLKMAPYNVYPALDGSLAILAVKEAHWVSLTKALNLDELRSDPRFGTKAERIRHMDELDALIGAATRLRLKATLVDALIAVRVPCAPVRELAEVVHDEHLHATGMLAWVDHPVYGRILAHGTPLRFADLPAAGYQPSAKLGADAKAVLAELLGVDGAEFADLDAAGTFGRVPPDEVGR
jgi:CoA:oxalate CoA-transferase